MEIASYIVLKCFTDSGPYEKQNLIELGIGHPYHPYLGWVHGSNLIINTSKAHIPKRTFIHTDANGYSITPLTASKPELRVVMTGGSSIFGVGSTSNNTTVPSLVEKMIHNRMGIQVELTNLAARGYQSFQEMLSLNRYLATNKADLVVSATGRNDASSCALGLSMFLPNSVWFNVVRMVRKVESEAVIISGLVEKGRELSHAFDLFYRIIIKIRPLKGNSDFSDDKYMHKLDDYQKSFAMEIYVRDPIKVTATHFACMNQMSKINGAKFIMLLQPSLYTKTYWTKKENLAANLNAETKGESRRYLREHDRNFRGEVEFYQKYVGLEKSFSFQDLSGCFSSIREGLFIDPSHYNDKGAKKFAEAIFIRIKPIIEEIMEEKRDNRIKAENNL